uniref:HMA domain-containing protein n=1 Tax=Kalanchoe fedtschenkoi TaxID=63787 RepID=A0A7N0RJ43_KALFE
MGEEEKKKPMEEKANKQQPDEKNPSTKDEEKKQGGVPEAVKEAPPPPPPPQEVVLKVFMHCEGCAKKVKRSLKGFPGVEDVITDSQSHKVVVKGEKADPVKVMERIQRKSHRKVELISPIPKPPEEEKPKAAAADQEAEKPKEAAKKEKEEEEPPQVITVVLKVHMHCEACSLAIKKRILRMKGVESVETDLKSSQVTVVGVFDPAQLVDYLHKRTGKQAAIVKQEPPPPDNKKEGEKGKDVENKQKEDGKICGEQREGDEKKAQGTEAAQPEKDNKGGVGGDDDEKAKLIELNKNEFYYYPAFYAPRFAMDQYYAAVSAHPPQLFSDENPNACNVM